jgi:TetR/AcrR family transcriptional regulator
MSQGEKRAAIIEAAVKRFIHFGVDKTTMNEIADDLSLSKASLYYYFPDKLNLYAAVLKTIIQADEANNDVYLTEKDPLTAISVYLENRTKFIIKYYNILEYLKTLKVNVPKELEAIFRSARTKELTVLNTILQTGQKARIIQVDDLKNTSELFLDCLDGLRYSMISDKINFFPDKKQFQTLLRREKEFASIFLKGLRP